MGGCCPKQKDKDLKASRIFDPNRPMTTHTERVQKSIKEQDEFKRIKTQDMNKVKFIKSFKSAFNVIKTLGKGSFGEVVEAMSLLTGVKCAIKIIEKARMHSELSKKMIYQVLEELQQIEHPCIMRVLEVLEDDTSFYIVSELLSEKLYQRLKRRSTGSERDAAVVF